MKSCKILCQICVVVLCSWAVSSCSKSKEVADSKTGFLATSKPESVGFSSERIEALHTLMQQAVDKKEISGAVTILARHGKVVDYRAYGQKDIASGTPMTKDAIFRDYSMTKPVTGVAMMILYEEGKWLPSDPIAKYIPEFAHLKVFKSTDTAGNPVLEDPVHPPTMRPGFGFGYDCAVEFDPPAANLPEGPGTFFWEGIAGTWFWIDPANNVVFVGMIQRIATDPGAPVLDSLSPR